MSNGAYRHLVSLQQPVLTTDSVGQQVKSWVEVSKVYAAMNPPSLKTVRGASENVLDGAVQGINMIVFDMRPRQDVLPSWRIVYNGQNYDIKSVRQDNRGTVMSLFCEVGGSSG